MTTVPGQLIWEIVKRNNCFLVKEFGNGNAGVQFSKEPNNLYNLNSYKYSGTFLHHYFYTPILHVQYFCKENLLIGLAYYVDCSVKGGEVYEHVMIIEVFILTIVDVLSLRFIGICYLNYNLDTL